MTLAQRTAALAAMEEEGAAERLELTNRYHPRSDVDAAKMQEQQQQQEDQDQDHVLSPSRSSGSGEGVGEPFELRWREWDRPYRTAAFIAFGKEII